MKFSSRKQLLIQADEELKSIRESINYKKHQLNESNSLTSLLSNAFTHGIVGTIVKYKNISKLPISFWSDATFLLGDDILKSGKLKIDSQKAKEVSDLIEQIINDFKTNSKLKNIVKKLNSIQYELMSRRERIVTARKSTQNIVTKKLFSGYDQKLWKQDLNQFNNIIEKELNPLITSILNQQKYNNFTELLSSVFSGLNDGELKDIKNKYISIIKKRASTYLSKYITYKISYSEFLGMPKKDYPPGKMDPMPLSSDDAG